MGEISEHTSAHSVRHAAGLVPFAIFGVENDGIGMVLNLLIIFLVALDIALIFWTYNDARRRLSDPVLIGSAVLAAVIFPFAGALVYMIVRPPESLEDAYERDLDIRAAELRVRLLEQAVRGGSGSAAAKAALSGELTGEPPVRRSSEASPRRSAESSKRAASGPQSAGGARRAEATNPTAAQRAAGRGTERDSEGGADRGADRGSDRGAQSRSAADQPATRPSQSSKRPASGPTAGDA